MWSGIINKELDQLPTPGKSHGTVGFGLCVFEIMPSEDCHRGLGEEGVTHRHQQRLVITLLDPQKTVSGSSRRKIAMWSCLPHWLQTGEGLLTQASF